MSLKKRIMILAATILGVGVLLWVGILSMGIKDMPQSLGEGFVMGFSPLNFGTGYNGRGYDEYEPRFCPEAFRYDEQFILLYGRLAAEDIGEEELHRGKYSGDRKVLRERFSPVFYIVTKADGTVHGPMDLSEYLIARDFPGRSERASSAAGFVKLSATPGRYFPGRAVHSGWMARESSAQKAGRRHPEGGAACPLFAPAYRLSQQHLRPAYFLAVRIDVHLVFALDEIAGNTFHKDTHVEVLVFIQYFLRAAELHPFLAHDKEVVALLDADELVGRNGPGRKLPCSRSGQTGFWPR